MRCSVAFGGATGPLRSRRRRALRCRPFDEILDQYLTSVRPMHLQFVEPSKRWADLIIPEPDEAWNPNSSSAFLQPDGATACNCTACRRYGTLWAYDFVDEGIHVTGTTQGLTASSDLVTVAADTLTRRYWTHAADIAQRLGCYGCFRKPIDFEAMVTSIRDVTPQAHNGCRPRKRRRV